MNDCVDLITEMSQFGLLELSESQGVFEEDEQDGAPSSQKDSQKPASQCMFNILLQLLDLRPISQVFFNEFF